MGSNVTYVAIEGIEGAGKTELCGLLTEEFGKRYKPYSIIYIKEPSTEGIGRYIREGLIKIGRENIDVYSQLCFFIALRRENKLLCDQKIREKLNANESSNVVVLLDRFIDSTFVYQGHLGGISMDLIHSMSSLAWDLVPDLTIWINQDPKESAKRVIGRKDKRDSNASNSEYLKKASKAFKLINATDSDIRTEVKKVTSKVVTDLTKMIIEMG